ncbi:MAG: tRNA pseudouridine(55) synthase TruB [Gorillibacterium sp.]|nr:tRNA pseudouridine(55) synthase TruB [Gorillibacterium sp.]
MTLHSLEGVLPVKKPVGFTSHDVVAKVRRITGVRRIGHTGTLDPAVTGVLPLCIGRATRVVEYIQELPKEYEAVLTVGYSTDTEDATGRVTEQVDKVEITSEQVVRILASYVGVIEQIPPMFSAVKVDGKRLYELAREGKEVERKARKIQIYEIELLQMDLDRPHPEIRFRAKCSKGTYIRTLCTDIGRALGYPAVMSGLVRTSTGFIQLSQCFDLEEIAERMVNGTLQGCMIPADQAVTHIPSYTVSEAEARKALQGQSLPIIMTDSQRSASELFRLYGSSISDPESSNSFLGIFRYDEEKKLLKPEKVFN